MELILSKRKLHLINSIFNQNILTWIVILLCTISVFTWLTYYENGLGVAYNDARSHLNIGRRVVEGLKPGLAQIGSVWLPLPHVLMIPLVWHDFLWHSGLAGAIQSMVAFVATGVIIYMFLLKLGVGLLGRLFGVLVFIANLNILYLQSTAMTELLLLATMTAGAYYLMLWVNSDNLLHLIKSAFFIMLSTVTRYDGWFLLFVTTLLIAFIVIKKRGWQETEGKSVLFLTLASFGIVLWFLWNLLIFGDPLYFAFGPFSAHTQQSQIEAAGELLTKHNLFLSIKIYFYALFYNSYTYGALIGFAGAILFFMDETKNIYVRIATFALAAPLLFNIVALYLGHSVLFVPPISGNSLFNVRYGVMLMPSFAIFSGYLVDRIRYLSPVIISLFVFVTIFAFTNHDAVSLDDARVGASGKNVTEVSGWLARNTNDKIGYILISAASHDAIIFSSGLPMKKFIHEGTGKYWDAATTNPDQWARWIVMRTYDDNDLAWKHISQSGNLEKYTLVESYPFADIYKLDENYLLNLIAEPVFKDNADLKKYR